MNSMVVHGKNLGKSWENHRKQGPFWDKARGRQWVSYLPGAFEEMPARVFLERFLRPIRGDPKNHIIETSFGLYQPCVPHPKILALWGLWWYLWATWGMRCPQGLWVSRHPFLGDQDSHFPEQKWTKFRETHDFFPFTHDSCRGNPSFFADEPKWWPVRELAELLPAIFRSQLSSAERKESLRSKHGSKT